MARPKVVLKCIFFSIRTFLCVALIIIFLNTGFNLTVNLIRINSNDKIPLDLLHEYNYLKSLLDRRDSKVKTTTSGTYDFASSEWPVMTYSFFCFGARNIVMKDPSYRDDASKYMRLAIERVMKPEYYNFMLEHFGNPFQDIDIKDNAFYLGHFTMMLAAYREVSNDPTFDDLFHKFARSFYENFKKSPTYTLDSYPGLSWSSEQVVPLRALKIHDDIFKTNYSEVVYKWGTLMEKDFIDKRSGLMVTSFDSKTGHIFQGPRTIANAFAILFMHDILPDLSQNLYKNMKKGLIIKRLGFPAFKEYLEDPQIPTGDTGPIIFGVSAVSTVFGMGAAAVMDDQEVYLPLRFLSDVLGLGVTFGDKKKYLSAGSIGTAVTFFCKSSDLFSGDKLRLLPAKNIFALYCIILILLSISIFWLRIIIRDWREIRKA